MSFWSRLFGPPPNHEGITPNANEPPPPPGTVSETGWRPGEAGAIEWDPPAPLAVKPEALNRSGNWSGGWSGRGLSASPWSGWPGEWSTPNFGLGPDFGRLVDVAWACLDLNASVVASMPPYRLEGERIAKSPDWMRNPDPDVYSSWEEFAKQVFWDYQNGEVFILATSYEAGWPARFRVLPPWMVNVELAGDGTRRHTVGGLDVTGDLLHIRYQSTTEQARGHGPLEVGGARMVAAGVLAQYVQQLAQTGGQTHEWLEIERQLTKSQADDLLDQYVASRMRNLGNPGVVSGGAALKQSLSMSAKDMALLELSQYSESRIAVLLGVPPFLVGLPSGGDSMTYSNTSTLFDFHYRSSLRPKGRTVMSALSQWALPEGESAEINHEDYTRPALPERASAYAVLHGIEDETGRALNAEEIRTMERMHGTGSASALTGGGGVAGPDGPDRADGTYRPAQPTAAAADE